MCHSGLLRPDVCHLDSRRWSWCPFGCLQAAPLTSLCSRCLFPLCPAGTHCYWLYKSPSVDPICRSHLLNMKISVSHWSLQYNENCVHKLFGFFQQNYRKDFQVYNFKLFLCNNATFWAQCCGQIFALQSNNGLQTHIAQKVVTGWVDMWLCAPHADSAVCRAAEEQPWSSEPCQRLLFSSRAYLRKSIATSFTLHTMLINCTARAIKQTWDSVCICMISNAVCCVFLCWIQIYNCAIMSFICCWILKSV